LLVHGGKNFLPHAASVQQRAGRLEALGVATREQVYYNRQGQRIRGDLRGRFA
jgi:5-methylphenazine-1-carboxylate 1-monooxygenase